MSESAEQDGVEPESTRWASIDAGAELSATVLFAAGFAFDADKPVREGYRVERKLGSGAMGQVLEIALQGEQSQQHFALKLVARPRGAGASRSIESIDAPATQQHEAATRWLTGLLRSEAAKQEAAQRHGVSVARFVALVRLDDGSLGLRMEMARGRSWGELVDDENLRRGDPPDLHRAIRATRKLLGQLRRVHSIREPGAPSGFVHSDIKPTNVFVDDADPSDPTVTLLDFGVATAGRAAIEDEAALLGRETFVLRQTGGTPGYAPPGHFNARPSPASDVHAAIVCLYEWIALALPWDIDELDPTPAGFALMELRISSAPRSVRELRPSIETAVAALLDQFFVSAFRDLQARSLAWASAVAGRDEAAKERVAQLTDELATLAGEYQQSLDSLAKSLESMGVAPLVAASAIASKPPSVLVPLVVSAKAEVAPSAIDTAPTIVAAGDTLGGKAKDATSKPDLLSKPWGDASADEARVSLPVARESWRTSLSIALVTIVAIAGAAGLYRAVRRAPTSAIDRGADASIASSSDAAPDGIDAPDAIDAWSPLDAGAIDPGVSLAVEPSVPLDERALPRAFRGGGGRAGATVPGVSARDASVADSSALPVGATVLCVAPALGVRVIARGGALDREQLLCETELLSDATTQEFAGRGVMDAEVLRALPTVQCAGEGRWLTTVRRFSASNGSQTWLFRCARPAPDPVEPSRPDASPTSGADPVGAAGSNSDSGAGASPDVAAVEPTGERDAGASGATGAPEDAQRPPTAGAGEPAGEADTGVSAPHRADPTPSGASDEAGAAP